MIEWNGYLCNGVRLAVALVAAALGAGSIVGAGDAWSPVGAAQAEIHPLRACAANVASSRSTNPARALASTKLASKPLRASA